MLVVGIDVGGTHTKFGLVENGNIIRSMELGTNTFDVIRQLCNGAREIVQSSDRSWDEVDGIAIGFPGMVIDSVVMDSPNVSLQNCNLKDILEKDLGKFVVVRNDAEMATLAEHKLGAGADCDNMVMITLGTGIGGGIIANKKLYVGSGGAGELGHIVYVRNGRPCTCGRKGCAELYLSMIALDRLAKDIMVGYPNTCVDFNGDGEIYASELAKAYKKNDACAIEVVDKYVDDLTQYLLDLCNIFRPNRIVIGGGITHAPELIDMVARNCRRLEYGYKNSPKVDILAAQLGNKAGILGGYVCVEEELNRNEVDEDYINEIEEEINAESQNMSLLDSIALRLDKPVSEKTIEEEVIDNIDDQGEETSGLYVNKFLDDITSEIDTIKNEQLSEDVESTPVETEQSVDILSNIFETSDSEGAGLETNSMFETDNVVDYADNTNNYMFDVQSAPIEEPKAEAVNEVVENPVEEVAEEEKVNITVDNLLESLKNTTANLNSAMSKMDFANVSGPSDVQNIGVMPTLENSTDTLPVYENNVEAVPTYDNNVEQFANNSNTGLGISDIFFNNATTESLAQEPVFNDVVEQEDQSDMLLDDNEYTEAEMQETEVVYDDNLLNRVNAMLTKKNQE